MVKFCCLLQVGVLNCPDNNPSNSYLYLVCVVTGWWRDAGTSANVFVNLKGQLITVLLVIPHVNCSDSSHSNSSML